uniref:Uncharacterized protein n=1 Tax=Moschus moschiferus TaxID=68415 RepID=A0A8C6CJB8_MOSMO
MKYTFRELEVLRKQRLAELQPKHGDPGDAAQQEAKHRKEELRNSILAQVLDQSARAQLSIRTRFNRNPRKSKPTEKKTTVKFNRRKVMESDEDDGY